MTWRDELQGIRAVAILAVAIGHADPHLLPGYHLGVAVFFVLSGYLITSMLVDERERTGTVDLRRFYRRRVARLLPALVPVIAACALFLGGRYGWRTNGSTITQEAMAALFFVMNARIILAGRFGADPLVPMWSLSIEEQFYLAWPFAFRRLRARGRRSVVAVLVAGTLAVVGVRCYGVLAGWSQPHLYLGTDCRADGLLMGCLAAVLLHRRTVRLHPALVALAVTGMAWTFATSDLFGSSLYLWQLPLLQACTLVVIVEVVMCPDRLLGRMLSRRPLVLVGRISYSMYIWHYLLLELVGGRESVLRAAVLLTVSLPVAYLSWRFVEEPARQRLGRRVSPRVAQTTA